MTFGATGPDGISREDLLKLPKPLVLRLLKLIHQSEQTGQWDPSILTGLIVALEKHDQAKGPQDYRPICVFSLVYRCWSSIRARQFLQWLVRWVHPSLLGHMPGRSTADLWYRLAMRIENSLYLNDDLSGSVELHDFWTWLKRSQAPLSQKLRALSGVAWPRCLHGIPGAIIGLDHFGRLRSAAMAALGFDKVGANPLVQLSLVCSPSIDPGFFALWSTLRTFRRLAESGLAFPLLNMLKVDASGCKVQLGLF